MICPNCNSQINDDTKFCGKCGKKIPRCPTCGKPILKRARFCVNDGTLLPEGVLELLPKPLIDSPTERVVIKTGAAISAAALGFDASSAEPTEVAGNRGALGQAESSSWSAAGVSHAASQHYCIQCGRPCDEGQMLCPSCQAQGAYATAQEDTPSKKNPLKIILIALIAALLLAGGVTAGYVLTDGFSFSKDSDADETQTQATRHALSATETGGTETVGESATRSEESNNATVVIGAPSFGEIEPTEPAATEPEITYVHTYEVIAADVSWEQAKSACEAKGGHLATITSEEEYQEICQLAENSGLVYLWIGASLPAPSDEWAAVGWITGEAWTFGKWYPGEPSKVDDDGTKEQYLCLWHAQYEGAEIGWTFNDQRNDIISVFPSTAGKVGYICEYESEVSR